LINHDALGRRAPGCSPAGACTIVTGQKTRHGNRPAGGAIQPAGSESEQGKLGH